MNLYYAPSFGLLAKSSGIMWLGNRGWGAWIRFALVCATWAVINLNYFLYSHSLHRFHFKPPPHFSNSSSHSDHQDSDSNHGSNSTRSHGRGGTFEYLYAKRDGLFLYGFSLPLAVVTVAAVVLFPLNTIADGGDDLPTTKRHSRGQVNVVKWTWVWVLVPLLLIMYDGAYAHFMSSQTRQAMGYNLWDGFWTSLLSPSGYAAVWSLAAFLIPVAKQSPLLDALRVTPVQALAFHRICGWSSLCFSCLHGYTHLRHLMDVTRRGLDRSWHEQLLILTVPPSWECVAMLNPLTIIWHPPKQEEMDNRCWLALINFTGLASTAAFLILGVTSLERVRRSCYRLFFAVHIPLAWVMLIFAIWHYPTCALVLIPNIMYYMSFSVPLLVQQTIACFLPKSNISITQVKLIRGGVIEITFITDTQEIQRHDARFVKLWHPELGAIEASHPFSIFAPLNQVYTPNERDNNPDVSTHSIIFRPAGYFTKRLANLLIPGYSTLLADEGGPPVDAGVSRNVYEDSNEAPHKSIARLQFDAYYAGSFDWVDTASECHDEIMLVAGGVGVAPFLEFLPKLRNRILTIYSKIEHDLSLTEEDISGGIHTTHGPAVIHLHWYCRDTGLASYVWFTHLRAHVLQSWESHPVLRGRLMIHIHLTRETLDDDNESSSEERLMQVGGNQGLLHLITFRGTRGIVRDSKFVTSSRARYLPALLMTIGTAIHWWFYKSVILCKNYRDNGLAVRAHGIVLALLVAVVLSALVEAHVQGFHRSQWSPIDSHEDPQEQGHGDVQASHRMLEDPLPSSTLTVTLGRPSTDAIMKCSFGETAKHPGVYMCGPRSLLRALQYSVGRSPNPQMIAIYSEDSEL